MESNTKGFVNRRGSNVRCCTSALY